MHEAKMDRVRSRPPDRNRALGPGKLQKLEHLLREEKRLVSALRKAGSVIESDRRKNQEYRKLGAVGLVLLQGP